MMREPAAPDLAATPDLVERTSPRTIARIIGALILLTIFGGVFAQGYVSERLVVWRDAAVTGVQVRFGSVEIVRLSSANLTQLRRPGPSSVTRIGALVPSL